MSMANNQHQRLVKFIENNRYIIHQPMIYNYLIESIDDLINQAYQEGYNQGKLEYDFTKGR